MVIPCSGPAPQKNTDHLSDHARMRHNGDVLPAMPRSDAVQADKCPSAKLPITFSFGPGEVIVVLGKILSPDLRVLVGQIEDISLKDVETQWRIGF